MANDLRLMGGQNPADNPDLAHVNEGVGVKTLLSDRNDYPDTEAGVRDLARSEVLDAMKGPNTNLLSFIGDILGNLAQAILAGFSIGASAIGNLFTGIVDALSAGLDALGNALFGPDEVPVPDGLKAFRDGQRDILHRVDLLEGVAGYCAAYQDVNVNARWSTNLWRTLPFRGRLGPEKNIHVDEATGEMVLEQPGFYVIYSKVHAQGTLYTGRDYAYLRVQVLRPDGTIYSQGHLENDVPRNHSQSLAMTHPVVVSEPNCRVRVRVYSDNWRWWTGGSDYSTLHIVRHSADFANPGQRTVPDESNPN